jgi:hypothetical protein
MKKVTSPVNADKKSPSVSQEKQKIATTAARMVIFQESALKNLLKKRKKKAKRRATKSTIETTRMKRAKRL